VRIPRLNPEHQKRKDDEQGDEHPEWKKEPHELAPLGERIIVWGALAALGVLFWWVLYRVFFH
jgi:hypothetical protein